MFSSKEKKILDEGLQHPCKLPETVDILAHHIDSGFFVDLRRKLKGSMMCSDNNPRTRLYLLSTSAINWEKSNHLRYYYHMIHPYSVFRIVWETFMSAIYLLSLVFTPLQPLLAESSFLPRAIFDVFGIADIILTFRTGFQHRVTKIVVMDRGQVAKNYLKTWFALDVLATYNSGVLIFAFQLSEGDHWKVQVCEIVKLLRLITLMRYLDRVREWTSVNLFKFNLLKLVIVVFLLILWNACCLHALANFFKEKWVTSLRTRLQAFRTCLFRIVQLLALVRHGQVNSQDSYLLFAEISWLILGFVLKLVLQGLFIQIVLKQTSLGDKYYGIMQQFAEYMKSKNLPDVVRKRVFSYFHFRFDRNFFSETEILGNLSNQLRQEIIFHTRRELLMKTVMFGDLPNSLLLRLGKVMKLEIFLPNDVVVTKGHHADVMFFMQSGLVAVYNTQGKEVCHLGDGSYFGEAALFSNDRVRLATVMAVDFCEMFTLSQEEFSRIVAPYPDLLERILKISNNRLQQFMEEESRRSQTDTKVKWNDTRVYYSV